MQFTEAIIHCSVFFKLRDLGAHRLYLHRPRLSVKNLLGSGSRNIRGPPSSRLLPCYDCHICPSPLRVAGCHTTLTPCKRSVPQLQGQAPLLRACTASLLATHLPQADLGPAPLASGLHSMGTQDPGRSPCHATGAASPTGLHMPASAHIWAKAELE